MSICGTAARGRDAGHPSHALDIALAILSGGLLLVAAPPAGVPMVAFVALVPLLVAARRTTGGASAAAALGWLTGAVFYAGLVPWLMPTIARMQGLGTTASAACFALFVAYHAAQVALAAVAMWFCVGGAAQRYRTLDCCAASAARPLRRKAPGDQAHHRPAELSRLQATGGRCERWCDRSSTARRSRRHAVVATAAGVAAAWVLLESGFPKVFPWSLGAALGPQPLLRQAAEVCGVHGLAALVVTANALLAFGARGARLAALGIIATLAGYAAWRLPVLRAPSAPFLMVGLLQASQLPPPAEAAAATDTAWRFYAARSRALAPRVDLLLWPESVLRTDLSVAGGYRDAVEGLAAALRRPLVVGGLGRAPDGRETNAIYAFAPRLVAVHAKTALVPFGEYVPGATWWPMLNRWQTTGSFAAGAGAAPLSLASGRAAVAVCFEAIQPGAFNAQVRDGGRWLLNPSDDGWFASPRAAAQHLEMTRLRAVETRRWLVRVSHSGASAIIDPTGDVVAALPYAAPGALAAPIAPRDDLTPYARWGDAPLLFASILVSGCTYRRRTRRGRPWPARACGQRASSQTRARQGAPLRLVAPS
jgi:apolipoprotein N-acyltransferase